MNKLEYDTKIEKYIKKIEKFSFEYSSKNVKDFILDSIYNSNENLDESELEDKAKLLFKEELKYLLKNKSYKVYRSVELIDNDLEHILKKGKCAGVHWTTEPNVANRWIASENLDLKTSYKKKYILEANIDLLIIDIEWTIANRIACPHEFEITLKEDECFKIDIKKDFNHKKLKKNKIR